LYNVELVAFETGSKFLADIWSECYERKNATVKLFYL